MFLKELQKFSRENWWVYIMLITILWVVYYTGNWNIVEITLLFVPNFIANLFVMVAIWNYAKNNNKIGSIYHISSTITFTLLWLYGAIFDNQYQYLIFQISFMLAAVKAVSFYALKKDFKIINETLLLIVNIILLAVFIFQFEPWLSGILLWVWFAFVTTGLVSIKDSFRYFMNLIWSFIIVAGASVDVYTSFIWWNLSGIALWFMLLSTTAILYFLKLLPSYLVKIKK